MATRYGASAYRNDGSSSDKAAPSARAIKRANPSALDGVYWINVPNVGPTQIYCIMNDVYDGGGWMMAMKATRGTTFNYSSNYWSTTNTLNSSDTTRNDGDAKFHTMNYSIAKDMLAIWPDISTGTGGSIKDTGAWVWLQNNFYNGNKSTLVNFFNTVSNYQISAGKSFSGWESGAFSSQSGNTFYGFNFTYFGSKSVRWGFGWNNETDWYSNDVSGGIGMESGANSYSAGDFIGCCQDTTGINRSARVEVYIR